MRPVVEIESKYGKKPAEFVSTWQQIKGTFLQLMDDAMMCSYTLPFFTFGEKSMNIKLAFVVTNIIVFVVYLKN